MHLNVNLTHTSIIYSSIDRVSKSGKKKKVRNCCYRCKNAVYKRIKLKQGTKEHLSRSEDPKQEVRLHGRKTDAADEGNYSLECKEKKTNAAAAASAIARGERRRKGKD